MTLPKSLHVCSFFILAFPIPSSHLRFFFSFSFPNYHTFSQLTIVVSPFFSLSLTLLSRRYCCLLSASAACTTWSKHEQPRPYFESVLSITIFCADTYLAHIFFQMQKAICTVQLSTNIRLSWLYVYFSFNYSSLKFSRKPNFSIENRERNQRIWIVIN